MNGFLNTVIGRFRLVALLEGVSFLLLLLICMPLKYIMGIPEAVKYMGWVHGVLFILYIVTMTQAALKYDWTFGKTSIAFAMSLVPAGTLIYDKKLKQEITNDIHNESSGS